VTQVNYPTRLTTRA